MYVGFKQACGDGEHCLTPARVAVKKTSSNPVEALIVFRLLLSNCLNWKFTVMIILHFHLQTQFKYEFFHIYFSLRASSPFGSHARFILSEIYLGLTRDLGPSRERIGAGTR